jgi:hypothetical protein
MALIRGHHDFDDHFTQIPNDWVRDDRLTLEARGLLAQIMSHRPGWNLSIKSLATRNSIGRDKVKRILDELLKYGYLDRSETQSHDDKGHLAGYDYTTKDPRGVTQEPYKAEPYKVEPYEADRPPKKTIPIEEHSDRTTFDKKDSDFELLFAEWWKVYPNKKGKGAAKTAYRKALKKLSHEQLLAFAASYASDPNRVDKYTPYPQKWLNQERWDDEPDVVLSSSERLRAEALAEMERDENE